MQIAITHTHVCGSIDVSHFSSGFFLEHKLKKSFHAAIGYLLIISESSDEIKMVQNEGNLNLHNHKLISYNNEQWPNTYE